MSTRRSLAWSFGQEFGQKALGIVGSIVIARLLTPAEVGIFALGMAASYLISTLREFGVGSYLIREPELTADKIRTAFGLTLTIQWTLGLIVLLARHPLAELYGEPGIASVLLLTSVSFFVTPFGQPALSLLQRDMRFDVLHHIALATGIVSLTTSITLAALGFSYLALAWGMVAATVVHAALLLLARRDHLRLRPSLRHWRQIVRFGGWLTIAGIFGTIVVEGRKLILGGLLNPAAVALVDRALQIPTIAREALFMPVGRVLLPSFSKDIRDGRSIGPSVELLVAATTGIIWPLFLTVGFLSVPLIVLLFGENWRVAGEILPYILVAAGLIPVLPQPDQILVPHGRVRRLAQLRLFQSLVVLTLATIGAMHSLELFAALFIVDALIFVTVNYLAIRHLMGTGPTELLPAYGKALALSLLCAAPALAAYLQYSADVPPWLVVASLLLAGALWLGGIFLLRHPLAREAADIGRQLRRRSSQSG